MAAAPGRPLDPRLTSTLLSSTVEILARDGLGRITTDAIATHARAGKAAIYRRWPSLDVLIADAMTTCELIPDVPDHGPLRDALCTLFQPWTRPLDRGERAAAALLGHAGRGTHLDAVLTRSVVVPLAAAVGGIADRQAGDHPALSEVQRRLLTVVVQSMWWQRYTAGVEPCTAADLAELLDRVLLPVATG